jgi:hypothetical protein
MPTSDFYRQHSDDGNLGGPGGINDRPTFYFYIDARSYNSGDSVCNNTIISGNVIQAWAEKDLRSINVGDYIYEIPPYENASFAGNNKWYNLYEPGTSARKIVQITNSGRVNALHTCTRIPPPPPDPVEDPIPPIKSKIPSPVSDLIYEYFVLENLSRSKKIFAYYSGSQNFNYTFSTTTSSADPGAGFFRLNSGSEGSDGTTNENQSTEMYIDIKDNQGEEDIITYLTSLSSSLSNAGTPETPYGEVQLYISGSGADQYYHRFNLQNVTFEGSTPAVNGYFKLDIITEGSDPGSNPLSSSIAAGSGSNVEVRFFNDIIPGYHETEVTSLDKDYVVACITQTASYGSGSISQPFAISWGMPENEFLNPDFYPTQPGYAWLWNDGYKVKHIKINNQSFGGDRLTDFVKKSDWSRFVLYNPFNAQGNLLHTADGNYPETFYLHNVTKYKPYTHLFVNQENRDTTFAVDSQNFASNDHNFLAEGKYIVDAKASGTVVEPIITTNISESIPQGYFPSGSSNYPTEQFFRGWVDANYYSNGTLVGTGGNYNDPLRQFETGSTERDYDAAPSYIRSTLPFFINATSSYIPISSSDFGTYSSQPNTIRVGPGLRTTGGDVLSYYYEETTGKILISGDEHLDTKKTEDYIFNNLYDIELVAPSDETTRYFTPDNLFSIEVKPSQSLWLSRGRDTSTAGDTDRYKYNRYLHRPYKAYVLLGTGSTDAGYGEEDFASAIYGSGSVPVGPPVNEAVQIFMNYSQSSANLRPDGIYTFDTLLSENVGLTASVDLSYRSDTYVPPTIYGQSEYGDSNSEYGGAGSGTNILTWRTASLNIYKNSSILASETLYLEPTDIEAGSTITVKYPLLRNQISTGDILKLALEVDTTDTQPFNAALIATSYTMSIGGTVPPTDDKVPVTFNNYLELNDDCDPLVSNIVNDRPNARLQDVDYSSPTSGSFYPVNFEQILRDEAVRATVPESNYTKAASANPRYLGSRSNSQQYNVFTEGDEGTFGRISNIDINKAYFGYFSKIYDLYPLLEGTTTLDIKYIFDANGNRFNPRLGSYNYYNLEGTFEDGSTLTLSTNPKEDESLIMLNTNHRVKHVGVIPTPILYSQIGGREYTGSINFTGINPPQPEPPTFNDYSFRASSSVFPTQTRTSTGVSNYDISITPSTNLDQLSPDFATSGSGDNVTSSYDPGTGTITFPTDDYLAPEGQGNNKPLSDNYSFSLEHTFETTPIVKRLTKDSSGFWQWSGAQYDAGRVGNYYLRALVDGSMATLSVSDVILEFIHTNPNTSNGVSSHSVSYMRKFSKHVYKRSGYVRIDFHVNDMKNYMNSNGLSYNLSSLLNGNGGNHSGTWVKCRWTIKATVKPKSSGFFQSPYFKQGDNIKISTGGFFGANSDGGRFQNYFYPQANPHNGIQFDRFILSNTKSAPPEGAIPPYWRVVANTTGSILEMQSEKVNEAYNNKLKQVDIPYIPSTWPKFPFGQEPNFVTFPNITKLWNLELNDEIKFENNESKVYRIIDISPPEESGTLRVTINPPIEDFTTDFDFFIVRRFIEEKGTIILSTPKPYFPSISGSVTTVIPSTSPGIILPEFPVKEIDVDPNLIIKDLEDKKLIE